MEFDNLYFNNLFTQPINDKCIIEPTYHLIFLGDLVDRGSYGYEIIMLIYL